MPRTANTIRWRTRRLCQPSVSSKHIAIDGGNWRTFVPGWPPKPFFRYDNWVISNMIIWNNHPVSCTTAGWMQLVGKPVSRVTYQNLLLNPVKGLTCQKFIFKKHGIPVGLLKLVGSFQIFQSYAVVSRTYNQHLLVIQWFISIYPN